MLVLEAQKATDYILNCTDKEEKIDVADNPEKQSENQNRGIELTKIREINRLKINTLEQQKIT